MTLNDSNAPRI